MRINHGGHRVGRVVEAVDEFKTQREDQGQQEQGQCSGGDGKNFGELVHLMIRIVFHPFCAEGFASEYVTIS